MSQAQQTRLEAIRLAVKANGLHHYKTATLVDMLKAIGLNATTGTVNAALGRFNKVYVPNTDTTKLTANKAALLASVKQYAMDHYEEGGWDIVVECYDDAELLSIIGWAFTEKAAVARVAASVGIIAERRAEVQAEIF
jgi:hypothetical protein